MTTTNTRIDRMNRTLVELICATMVLVGGFEHDYAEREIMQPWLAKHETQPALANLEVWGKVFKHTTCKDAILAALDRELVMMGEPKADDTLVGHHTTNAMVLAPV